MSDCTISKILVKYYLLRQYFYNATAVEVRAHFLITPLGVVEFPEALPCLLWECSPNTQQPLGHYQIIAPANHSAKEKLFTMQIDLNNNELTSS